MKMDEVDKEGEVLVLALGEEGHLEIIVRLFDDLNLTAIHYIMQNPT